MAYNSAPHRDWRRQQRPQNTRVNQLRDRRGPTPVLTVVRPHAEWRNWRELSLKLEGLDPVTTTLGLWKDFSREGEIVFIDIYERPGGFRDGSGKISFCPPPKEAFWTDNRGQYRLTREDGTQYLIRVILLEHRDELHVQSPVRKHISYEPQMKLVPQQLDFGVMEEEHTFMSLRRVIPRRPDEISFTVNLQKRRIEARFAVSFIDPRSQGVSSFATSVEVGRNDRVNTYMFQVPFGQPQTIKLLDYDKHKINDHFGLLLALESPPQFFRKQLGLNAGHTAGSVTWTEFDTWFRQTDIDYDPPRLQTAKVALHKDQPEIDIGRWTTYLFTFKKSTTNKKYFDQMKQALLDFNIEIVEVEDLINWDPSPAKLWSFIDTPSARDSAAELSCLEPDEISFSLPFEVRYQLEVCLSKEYINEHNVTREFVESLSILSYGEPAKARSLLEYVAEQGKRVYDPFSIFQDADALAFSPRTDIPYYCAHVRKATITPTTIYFSTPTVETTNRVLRHYARENQDGRFLRVQFTDEVFEGKINSTKKTCNDELFTRVYRTLYNGIQIGDRHYEFLAFGNSQFRENGAYFFCRTADLSCDDIRSWMGHFSHINVVAKYAARLGQCFSTTRAINGLSNPTLVKIDDIERNGFCFTDGVGKISSFMAQMIATELGIQGNTAPSAFQFRLGGCKGVLVVSPDAKEKEVHIRPSQQKFAATYNGLEIIRCSQCSCASLNRQTITILSALGVPNKIFLDMLSEQLSNYQAAMDDDDLAVSLLCRYIDDTQMTINIATMIRNGFMAQRDPFVISLLHLWRAWSIKLLKEKAKIIVENGALVLGCVDETATLRGYTKPTMARGEEFPIHELPQIFIQVPNKSDPNKYNVIEGICLVGRNPSLHPGDLRVVQAINVPALHHLRNVVVFPQTGERDVPSMCSGGDLDGDDFFVLWDKGLQPPEWNCEPMNYAAPAPKVSRRPVRITDLMKFFVVFMKNDSLPTIAHAHLAQSDYLDDSVKDPKCLELANLHSKAVDYVKSGQPAEMPKRLMPRKWPHFMEKKHKSKDRQYTSGKILGLLYDRVESVNFIPQWEERFDPRILRAYKLEDALLQTVRQTKSQYDIAMRRILANQDISSEFEVWSTFVLSKPRVGSDYKYQEEVARLSNALKDQFRAICVEKVGGKDFVVLGPFVAGMYKVTKEELDIALAECRATKVVAGLTVPKRKMELKSMPLISFPWLFEKELGRIATGVDTATTMEELDLLPLGYKIDGASRKRQGGGNVESDDFVQQEDGVIVHRGEELDLFRPDIEDLADESFSDEDRSDEDLYAPEDASHPLIELDSFDSDSLVHVGGTGVEDVVAPTELEGLIGPLEAARRLHDTSAFLPALRLGKTLPPASSIRISTGVNSSSDYVPIESIDTNSGHLLGTAEDHGLQNQDSLFSALTNMQHEQGSSAILQVRARDSSGSFTLADGQINTDGVSELSEDISEAEEEIEEIEEVIDLVDQESALDRLSHMQRS